MKFQIIKTCDPMNSIRFVIYNVLVILLLTVSFGCEDLIDQQAADELAPGNFLSKEDGIITVLRSSYHKSLTMPGSNSNRSIVGVEEFPTDIHWQLGGGAHSTDVHFNNFTWDPSTWDWNWSSYYSAIRDANIVLENADNVTDMTENEKTLIKMEARFVRAQTYWFMYKLFGPVPLRTSTDQELELSRASEEEILNFIESEFTAALAGLPEAGEEAQYGRAHKMAARAFLIEIYMTLEQWQNAADMANEIINSDKYSLFPDYPDLFLLENERNSEYIWIRAAVSDPNRTHDNEYWTVVSPTDFQSDPDSGLEMLDQWVSFGSNYKLRDNFVMSFDTTNDARFEPILTRYINQAGDLIQALGNNDARAFKYVPSINDVSRSYGADIPEFRLAEILLFRAEALNELQGPNQESINLINEVRVRADLDELSLGDFGSREKLRDHILKERSWEFYLEGKRRHTLIRVGKFIETARNNDMVSGNPQEHHRRYPIPQFAIDANPSLEQNPGY